MAKQRPIAIPEPVNTVDSLWRTTQALKEAVEVIQGIRGSREYALKEDLDKIALGASGADGLNAVTISYTNQAHSVPLIDEDWTGSGGLFYAYQGGTALILASDTQSTSHAALNPGEFVIDIAPVSGDTLTEPTITGSGTTTATLSDWAGNLTQITVYRITASIRTDTVPVNDLTLSIDVSITPGGQGTDSRTVNLTAGQQVFEYLSNDTLNDNANTTITATALNSGGTPYYEFFVNEVSQQDTTANTYTYTPQANYANMPEVIEVHVTEDGTGGTIYARDQMTISGVKPGVDAPLIVQDNEAHTIPVSKSGVAEYAGSGNTLSVYLGATMIPYDSSAPYAAPSFRVTSAVGTNITAGTGTPSANWITYGDASAMTQQIALITYTIVVTNNEGIEQTVIRRQSFSKSVDGEDSITINYTNNSHTVQVDNLGNETWTGSGGKFYVYEGSTLLTLNTNTQTNSHPVSAGEYNIDITKISGDTLSNEPTITGASTTEATLGDWGPNDLTQTTVYRITAYVNTNTTPIREVTTSTDVTISPSEQGADGGDGRPGIPGASTICLYDNLDTDATATSAGRYHFLTSITNTSGTTSWSTITTLGGVDYFVPSRYSTSSTFDYDVFYAQVEVGDILTWWESDGRWVEFRITSIETPVTDAYKWGIIYVEHDETDGSGNINADAGNDVELRYSRAPKGTDAAGFVVLPAFFNGESIGTLPQTASLTFKTDGTLSVSGFTDLKWWSNAPETGIGSSYQVELNSLTGNAFDNGLSVGTWGTMSSDRTWSVTRTIMEGAGSDTAGGYFRIREVGEAAALAEGHGAVEAADT